MKEAYVAAYVGGPRDGVRERRTWPGIPAWVIHLPDRDDAILKYVRSGERPNGDYEYRYAGRL